MPLLDELVIALADGTKPISDKALLRVPTLEGFESVQSMAVVPLTVDNGQLVGAFWVCDDLKRVWTLTR